VALKHVTSIIKDKVQYEEMTNEEKVSQILNGKARFKIEKFEKNDCPWGMDQLFDFFEFDGLDEIEGRNNQRKIEVENFCEKAKREAQTLENKYVFEKLDDPVEAIDSFIEKYERLQGENK
jgi:hypothetical protein